MQDDQTSLTRYRLDAVGEWVATLVVWCCNRHVSCDCVRVTQLGGVGGSARTSAFGRDYVTSELSRRKVRKKFDRWIARRLSCISLLICRSVQMSSKTLYAILTSCAAHTNSTGGGMTPPIERNGSAHLLVQGQRREPHSVLYSQPVTIVENWRTKVNSNSVTVKLALTGQRSRIAASVSCCLCRQRLAAARRR
jgi:hypothetical protein